MENKIAPVYIEKLFKSKNPGLAKWTPGFVFSFLKKLICQDRINDFISKYSHVYGLDFANGILEYLDIKYKTEGEDRLPSPEGRYIFVSNHPLGGPDGIILIAFLGKHYKTLKFPVNDLLMNLKNLNDIFLPVNKHGGLTRDAVADIEKAFESDAQIITFPAGMVSRKYGGKIEDPQWQKNFITKAVRHKRDIVPLFVSGNNSKLFYRIFKIRKFFGIKTNFEMFLLPRETFGHENKTFTIKVGKPIPYTSFSKEKTPQAWADTVKQAVYGL